MNDMIKLLLSLTISGTIIGMFIFMIQPLIKHKISKSVQYYLWLIVLLRLIMPFSFEGSIMNDLFFKQELRSFNTPIQANEESNNVIINQTPLGIKENSEMIVYYDETDSNSNLVKDNKYQYIVYIWGIGVVIALLRNLIGYTKFLRQVTVYNKEATQDDITILDKLLNRKYNISLYRNKYISTPILIGIVNPSIIIPDTEYDDEQLKNILLHELSHLKRQDILIKWLTVIVTSIHWFNPFMYFIKKEINKACELACDESVIKNLNSAEKQSYGDTLISVVSEHRYPNSALQATMCEEKKSLKERLISIMNYTKKSKAIIIVSAIILVVTILSSLYLGASVGASNNIPPNMYVYAEDNYTRVAKIGTYNWSYRGNHINISDVDINNINYQDNNVVQVLKNQQIYISSQRLKLDKKYNFTLNNISVYKDNELIQLNNLEPTFINGNLYFQAPTEAGEYIYSIELNFKDKGIVNYGFVVRVRSLSYNLKDISKYKTPYVGNASKVGSIVGRLPVPDIYFKQQYMSLQTSETPYGLTVYYEPKASNEEYKGPWPIITPDSTIERNLRSNALVAFCMIDNADRITFALRTTSSEGKLDETKYNTSYTFPRESFIEQYGDLKVYRDNLDLLSELLIGKKSGHKGLTLYVWRKPELTGNNNLYYSLIDGNSKDTTENDIYNLDYATSDITKIQQELTMYISGIHLSIVHNMDINKDTMSNVGEELSKVIKNGSISIGGR